MNGVQRMLFIITVMLVSLGIFPVHSYADENMDDLELASVDIEKSDAINEKLIVSQTEIADKDIVNFDVNSKGEVLICLHENFVNVYNDSLDLMYSVSLYIDGTSAAFWYNDTAALYLNRSDMMVLIDENGIIDCFHVENTDDNYELINSKRKQRSYSDDEFTYELTYANDFQNYSLSAPSVLRRIKNGKTEMIYCNEKSTSNIVFGIVGAVLFFICLTLFVVFTVKKQKDQLKM